MAYSIVLDTHATASGTPGDVTIQLTTSGINRLAVLAIAVCNPDNAVSGGGLTWTLQSSVVLYGGTIIQTWTAPVPAQVSNVTITSSSAENLGVMSLMLDTYYESTQAGIVPQVTVVANGPAGESSLANSLVTAYANDFVLSYLLANGGPGSGYTIPTFSVSSGFTLLPSPSPGANDNYHSLIYGATANSTSSPGGINYTSAYTLTSGDGLAESGVVMLALNVPPVALLSASPNPITSCAPGPSTLTYQTYYTTSQTIDHGIGSVGTSGTVRVSPLIATTYTLSAIRSDWTTTAPVTVTLSGGFVQPDVTGDIAWFGSGQYYSPGLYVVTYYTGAYQYNPDTPDYGYTINGTRNINIIDQRKPHIPGFYVTNNDQFTADSNLLLGPGTTGLYSTEAACIAANTGLSVGYLHTGGPIGIWLNDYPYWDNVAGSPSPIFGLCGPCTVGGSASASTISLGDSVTITWSAGGADSVYITPTPGQVYP